MILHSESAHFECCNCQGVLYLYILLLQFEEILTKMTKTSANNMYLLLLMLFLAMSSMVGAVDIIFYSNSNACDGSGHSFNGVARQVCCTANGGSVLFRNMDGCKTSQVYKNGGCDRDAVASGTGNRCWVGGGFTSGHWYQSCRRRSLLADVESDTTKCQGLAKPSGIVFTEDAKKGTWVLTSPDAEELFSHLESLPHGEKASWIQSKSATFDTSLLS